MSNIFSCFFGMSLLLNFVLLAGYMGAYQELTKLKKELEDAQHQLWARRDVSMRAFQDPSHWT